MLKLEKCEHSPACVQLVGTISFRPCVQPSQVEHPFHISYKIPLQMRFVKAVHSKKGKKNSTHRCEPQALSVRAYLRNSFMIRALPVAARLMLQTVNGSEWPRGSTALPFGVGFVNTCARITAACCRRPSAHQCESFFLQVR